MTKADFLALEPRERDAAVTAVRAGLSPEEGAKCWEPLHHTTDIATAWELVEEMRAEGTEVRIESDGPVWHVMFSDDPLHNNGSAMADTLPLTASIAYMKAKGVIT